MIDGQKGKAVAHGEEEYVIIWGAACHEEWIKEKELASIFSSEADTNERKYTWNFLNEWALEHSSWLAN